MSEQAVVKIEKLVNNDNFPVWKKTLLVLLMSKGLMDIVEGKELKPVDVKKGKEWTKQDSQATFDIVNTIDSSLLKCFLNFKTTKEHWSEIKDKQTVI